MRSSASFIYRFSVSTVEFISSDKTANSSFERTLTVSSRSPSVIFASELLILSIFLTTTFFISKNTKTNKRKYKDITITDTLINDYKYTTIYYNDITDTNNFKNLSEVLTSTLKKYIKIKESDNILVVGLGNPKSTPDSLGPKTIENILVTRHLKILNVLDNNYSSVSTFKPSVIADTGIESINLIKGIIKDIKATKVIVIDALKASKTERLVKTIQITNKGINPGSGINNNRGEISKKTMNTEVVSTVVDIKTILKSILKEEVTLENNLILTPTDIDFQIEKLSELLSQSINKTLHKKLYPTK